MPVTPALPLPGLLNFSRGQLRAQMLQSESSGFVPCDCLGGGCQLPVGTWKAKKQARSWRSWRSGYPRGLCPDSSGKFPECFNRMEVARCFLERLVWKEDRRGCRAPSDGWWDEVGCAGWPENGWQTGVPPTMQDVKGSGGSEGGRWGKRGRTHPPRWRGVLSEKMMSWGWAASQEEPWGPSGRGTSRSLVTESGSQRNGRG